MNKVSVPLSSIIKSSPLPNRISSSSAKSIAPLTFKVESTVKFVNLPLLNVSAAVPTSPTLSVCGTIFAPALNCESTSTVPSNVISPVAVSLASLLINEEACKLSTVSAFEPVDVKNPLSLLSNEIFKLPNATLFTPPVSENNTVELLVGVPLLAPATTLSEFVL